MGIARYETVDICLVGSTKNSLGEQISTITKQFTTSAKVADVANTLSISEKYRLYSDLVHLTFNYTPAIKAIVDNQHNYSLNWRAQDWRITDVKESIDRMSVTILAYRNETGAPV
jgi:hypothetical protein